MTKVKLAVLALALALSGAACSGDPMPRTSASIQPAAASGQAPMQTGPARPVATVSAAEIDRQDRVPRLHRLREERAQVSRPLLALLPARRRGVRFSIGGLSQDTRRTLVTVELRGRSRRTAASAWRDLLRRSDDRGVAYDLVVVP